MNKLGISTANRDTYLAMPEVGVGQGNLTLPVLFREKYIVMFLSPEAWVDARRFNYAYTGFQLPQSALLSEPIRRIDYPSTEQSLNSTNVPQVPALTQRLWWDL